MRARLLFIVLAMLLVAGFAAMNWPQIVSPTSLNFGIFTMTGPLGLILLSVLAVTLVAFLVSSIHMQTVSLLDNRQHYKELQAQRDLADKAEASRFTDLRQHLDAQMREIHQRETIAATELEKAVAAGQREIRTQLELMNRTLASRLAEIEGRLEPRTGDQRTRVVDTSNPNTNTSTSSILS
jgi:mannitol-specific phosphotransferase system IIBC component